MASEFATGFFREQLGHRRCRGKLNFTSRSVTLMTMWEGVDLAERWCVWEHQSLSIGKRDTSPVLIVTLNCLGEWRKSVVWCK